MAPKNKEIPQATFSEKRKLWNEVSPLPEAAFGKNPNGIPYHDNPPTGNKNAYSKKGNHDGEVSEAWVSQGNKKKHADHNAPDEHAGEHNPTPVTGGNPREHSPHNQKPLF
jgi:hypothetical protein